MAKALALAPDRGEPHVAAAWIAYRCYLGYDRGLEEIAIAKQRLPNDPAVFELPGFIARRKGQFEQSIINLERAAELDPRNQTARSEMEAVLREQPDYAEGLCVLGMIDAALGRKEEALREGRRAVEVLPITKDASTGAEVARNLAIIYAWTGEKDLAIKQLEELLPLYSPISYGQLRLHPWWDPLRDHPRFEKITEEAKKPVELK